MQPWRTPFPIWNQSVIPCPVLTVASRPAYRFLKRQVRRPGIHISLRIFRVCCGPHIKDFGIVNKAEADIFLELSCFFDDPMDVGNLICGSSAFPKSTLNIWKFTDHILLKLGLENFEHYFTSMYIAWPSSDVHVVRWPLHRIIIYIYNTHTHTEKEMAIRSSTLAWRIPWTEDPARLQSMGSQRVGHDWVTSLHFTSPTHTLRCYGKTQINFLANPIKYVWGIP